MNIWLDDKRPAPRGWLWCKTVADAQRQLRTGKVQKASLDHDLGPQPLCAECEGEPQDCGACHCHSRPSNGCDLTTWMAASGHWSVEKPEVHSANPPGAKAMRATIDRYWPTPEPCCDAPSPSGSTSGLPSGA
jgi:hypothetical protein